MNWSPSPELRFRMVVAVFLLVACAVGFVVAVYVTFSRVVAVANWPALLAPGATMAVLAGILLLEYRQGSIIRRQMAAEPAAETAYPDLHATVRRVAHAADLPVPAVAVTDTEVPKAMTTGYTNRNATLVVSDGLLAALDSAQLEAVVAHELAHVGNHDTAVMTAASLPTVVAGAIARRVRGVSANPATGLIHRTYLGVVLSPLFLVGGVSWVVGRTILCTLSRSREFAADRAAVAITGSPAVLATALQTLDESIAELPDTDLRSDPGPDALSILPVDSEPDPVTLGPDGDREPLFSPYTRRFRRFVRWLFRTHPSTSDRIARLGELEAELETRRSG